ncbi:MAG TPA: hypothetical protein VFA89_12975 [Terriglobales bacterium]|nr:hypothetical protein [Terriglobales bacterium]
MRQVLAVCAVLLCASLAFGQATVISGWSSNVGWGGYYPPTQFVPLISTPSVSLQASSALAVGASNATAGLVAGATDATLTLTTPAVNNAYTVPVWSTNMPGQALVPAQLPGPPEEAAPAERMHGRRHLYTGSAQFLAGPGTAEQVKMAAANRRPAKRTFTNQDVDQLNQQNGTVKFRGKTEKI